MSILLVLSSQALTNFVVAAGKHRAASGPSVAEQVALLAVSAVFGFACSYALARLSSRRDPRKELSWDASVDRGVVAVGPEIRRNVVISYRGDAVEDLVAVTWHMANTGNRVVKNEEVRFAFSEGTRILDTYFEPEPEPELRAAIVAASVADPLTRKVTVGHLEKGQEVTVRIIVTGSAEIAYNIFGFNEEGDVSFQQREANRLSREQDHVVPFLTFGVLFLTVPALFSAIDILDLGYNFAGLLGDAVRLVFLIFLVPHIVPVARVVQRLIARWLTKPDPTTSVTVNGSGARFVASSGSVGDIELKYEQPVQ
ncbi:MAG TPA: hypothetical protein VFQ44_09470 [Streptosporangiaceae bacterium]|nr:hypothetical protein [Streptosporangiaceae bacterium]